MALMAGHGPRMTGAAVAFAALAAVVMCTARDGCLVRANRAAFDRVRASRTRTGIAIAHAVSGLAEPEVVYPVLAITSAVGARRAGFRSAVMPGLVISGAAVRRTLSRRIARPRPPAEAWLAEPEGYSLPSKHTTLAALAARACARSLGMRGAPVRAASLLAAAGVGVSRVYLGVHWPADVVAGWLFAEGWLCLIYPGEVAARNESQK
jgi:membrane-associated phospholipid phosphatase